MFFLHFTSKEHNNITVQCPQIRITVARTIVTKKIYIKNLYTGLSRMNEQNYLPISYTTITFMSCKDRKISLNVGHFEKHKSNRTKVNYFWFLVETSGKY